MFNVCPSGVSPFGGWDDSLFGDIAMYGPEGMRFYTKQKVITSRWPDPTSSQIDHGFPRTPKVDLKSGLTTEKGHYLGPTFPDATEQQ